MTLVLLVGLALLSYLILGMAWARVVEKYSSQRATPFDLAMWPVSALCHVGELAFYLAVGKAREEAYQKEKAERRAQLEKDLEDIRRGGTSMNVVVTRNEL